MIINRFIILHDVIILPAVIHLSIFKFYNLEMTLRYNILNIDDCDICKIFESFHLIVEHLYQFIIIMTISFRLSDKIVLKGTELLLHL